MAPPHYPEPYVDRAIWVENLTNMMFRTILKTRATSAWQLIIDLHQPYLDALFLASVF